MPCLAATRPGAYLPPMTHAAPIRDGVVRRRPLLIRRAVGRRPGRFRRDAELLFGSLLQDLVSVLEQLERAETTQNGVKHEAPLCQASGLRETRGGTDSAP